VFQLQDLPTLLPSALLALEHQQQQIPQALAAVAVPLLSVESLHSMGVQWPSLLHWVALASPGQTPQWKQLMYACCSPAGLHQ
jgi:hypothetical protein